MDLVRDGNSEVGSVFAERHNDCEAKDVLPQNCKQGVASGNRDVVAGGTGLTGSNRNSYDSGSRKFEQGVHDDIEPCPDNSQISIDTISTVKQPPSSSTATTELASLFDAGDSAAAATATFGSYGCQYCQRTGTLDQSLLSGPFHATRYHSLVIERSTAPADLEISAETDDGLIMAVEHRDRPGYGVQLHPESIASEHGRDILRNFLDLAAAFRARGQAH